MDYSFKKFPSCEAMLLIFEKEGNYRNLKSFYLFETPSFEKGGLGRI